MECLVLTRFMGPIVLLRLFRVIVTAYINITNKNQYDILMRAVADVSKGQIDMSYKGELQTLPKQSMRRKVCTGETCRTTIYISESAITMLMSRGRSNCGVTYYVNIYY